MLSQFSIRAYKTTIHFIALLILAAMVTLGLNACTEGSENDADGVTDTTVSNEPGNQSEQAEQATQADQAQEKQPIEPEPVATEPEVEPVTLVVYSGRKEKFVEPVMDAFTEATGIEIELYSGSAAQLLAKLDIEGENSPADLFLSNEAGTLQIGANKKLFTPLPESMLTDVPAIYQGDNRQWVGLSSRLRVLVVNNTQVEDGDIHSVWNLIAPELDGKIAITSSANGSFIGGASMYLAEMEEDGLEEWLVGLKENAQGQAYAKHSKVVADVAAGNRTVGLVNHYYIYRHLDANPEAPLQMVIPDQDEAQMGVAINVAGIAQVASSEHQEAGQQLIQFLLSDVGQKQFAEVNREYPVKPTIAAPGLPDMATIKLSKTPLGDLGSKRELTLEIIEKSGLP